MHSAFRIVDPVSFMIGVFTVIISALTIAVAGVDKDVNLAVFGGFFLIVGSATCYLCVFYDKTKKNK